jgi:hypothetical protein
MSAAALRLPRMGNLLGWIELAAYQTSPLAGTIGTGVYGNLFVYEDCAIWSHPNRAAKRQALIGIGKDKLLSQGYEEAGLTSDELLAKHKKNWRVMNDEVKRAWLLEYWHGGASADNWSSDTTPVSAPGYWAADLAMELLDGSRRKVEFKRRHENDHDAKRRFEGWLGDRLELGRPPDQGLLKGLRTKITGR